MPGPRQPTDLVKARGKKHFSQTEEDQRRDQEVHVQPPDRAEPPRWLGKKFHAEFREIGEILRQAGLYTELDRDVLGQFLVARERWLRSAGLASAAIRARDEKLAKEWTAVQSSYFRQCRQCAEVMGLSISSRCRLVVPEVLANAAKHWLFEGLTPCGWKQAQTTGGGLSLTEVTPSFQFKGCPGLYFVGETLDCAGSCGGFNLHWAFGSGIAAGRDAVRSLKRPAPKPNKKKR